MNPEVPPSRSGTPAPGASPHAPLHRPSLRQVTASFFRIGNTTFGGGIPTIAALHREFVERTGWLTPEEYGLAFALARITPGTNIVAFCAGTGFQMRGLIGALAGTLAVTIPSAVLAILITVGYETWKGNSAVMAAVSGTVAAVAGMMLATVWSLIRPFWYGFRWGAMRRNARALVFAGGGFLALWKFGLSPLQIIGLAVVGGLLWKEPVEE